MWEERKKNVQKLRNKSNLGELILKYWNDFKSLAINNHFFQRWFDFYCDRWLLMSIEPTVNLSFDAHSTQTASDDRTSFSHSVYKPSLPLTIWIRLNKFLMLVAVVCCFNFLNYDYDPCCANIRWMENVNVVKSFIIFLRFSTFLSRSALIGVSQNELKWKFLGNNSTLWCEILSKLISY